MITDKEASELSDSHELEYKKIIFKNQKVIEQAMDDLIKNAISRLKKEIEVLNVVQNVSKVFGDIPFEYYLFCIKDIAESHGFKYAITGDRYFDGGIYREPSLSIHDTISW